jgi:hypothetical protein
MTTILTAPATATPHQPTPLWHLRLHDTPCSVCHRPATSMAVYPSHRLVHHYGAPPCAIPNPPRNTTTCRDTP